MRVFKSVIILSLLFLLSFASSQVLAAEISAFGPQQYLRTTGAPNIYTESFTAYPGEARLIIYNGEPGLKSNRDNRVTSGKITLNGEVLFTHDDFKHQTYTLEIPIILLEDNSLRIELESKPGTYLSLEIIQDVPMYDLAATDLTVQSDNCPESVELSLQIQNVGEDPVPAGVPVSFYNGDPEDGGVLIGTTLSGSNLIPQEMETVFLQWNEPETEEIVLHARVDDDGTGLCIYEEEDEDNNDISVTITPCRLVLGNSSISGHIIDAVSGDLLSGVRARLHLDNNGLPGDVVSSVESDDTGVFFFEDLAAGSYIITVSQAGYIDGEKHVLLNGDSQLTNQDVVLSPILDEGEFRIVLTWKDTPADLEAHLTEPNPNGCRYHCYYFNKVTPTATLDLDDRDGNGPETITISAMVPGIYRFYVHDFTNRLSNSLWLAKSGAEVKVYSGDREPLVFQVPYAYGNVWHVFDIDGESGEIIPVHKMTRQSEPGRIDYPVIVSGTPSTSAYWGSTYKYQTKAVDPDDDHLSYALENAPSGMTINPETGLIQWTPGENQSGWYRNIVIRVDDGRCGETSKTFKVYVNSTPTANFSVSPCSGFNSGGEITFSWSTSRASTVLIDQGVGEVPLSGSVTIPSPETPTLYTLTAFNDASLIKRTTPAAPGASFYFSPRRIKLGQSTTLYWNSPCSTGRSISNGIGSVPVSGSQVVTPTRSGYYYIWATNPGGTNRYRAYVTVEVPPDYFTITPTCNMTPGAPMTLAWHINYASAVSISPDVGPVDATGTQVVYPTQAGTYTLTAIVNGGTVKKTVTFPNYPGVSLSPRYSKAIFLGQSVNLSYSSSCADTVVFNQGIGQVDNSGTITVTPESLPLTYTVTATNERGSKSQYVKLYHPAPTVNLSPYPRKYIDLGNSVTITWSTSYADTVSFNQGFGEVDKSGSITVTPESLPITYTLTASNYGGTTTRSVTLYQIKPSGSFSADPTILKVGNATTLTWASSRADTCSISPDIGAVDCNGTMDVIPTKPTTYTFTMVGYGGTIRKYASVTFVQPVADLDATPTTIKEGESSKLTWVFANATSCVINQGIGEVELGGERSVSPTTTTTYTMTATGPGGTAKDSVTVNVIPANPLPTLSLSLSERIIMAGSSTVLSWTSSYADSVEIDHGIGTVATSGSISLTPQQTTTYTVTATGPGGTKTAAITVTVMYPTPALNLSVNPPSVMAGERAMLSWNSEYADTVSINQGIGAVPLAGSQEVRPQLTTIYTFTATGPGGTTSKNITVTVTHPLPTVSFTAQPEVVKPGEKVTLSWSTTNADEVTIDQSIGAVESSGSLYVFPSQETVYTITATGPGGTVTEQATVTMVPSPITLSITSPLNGSTLSKPYVMVTGTVIHADGLETGVVVNGVVALVYDGQFVANHVPLDMGENKITAMAFDINNEQAEKLLTLFSEPTAHYIKLRTDTDSALAPMEFSLSTEQNFIVTDSPALFYSGPSDIEIVESSEPDTWTAKAVTPGIYIFTAKRQDGDAVIYEDQVAVLAHDRGLLDVLLQNKWNNMKTAMSIKDIEKAVNEFTYGQRDVFREIFTITQDKLDQIALDMQDIELIYQKNNTAEYRIKRDVIFKGTPKQSLSISIFKKRLTGYGG